MRHDISVVIPTYKRPKELAEAIDSVLAQTGASTEVIVVDDCPDGSAAAVAASYVGKPVHYLLNPVPSKGNPAIVRNLGWSHASGEYLHFLDDDDVVPQGHYARVLAAFAKSPSVGTVFGAIGPFGNDPEAMAHEVRYFAQATRRARQLQWFGRRMGFSAWLLSQTTFLVCSSAVVRRNCVAAVKGFDPRVRLVEDVDFLARAIRHGGARMIDSVAINYRIHASIMHDGSDKSAQLSKSYQVMSERYKSEHGAAEFVFMKIFARLLKAIPC